VGSGTRLSCLLVLIALAHSAGAAAPENNGTDPTRPRTQLVTLYDFVNQPGPAPDSNSTVTFRAIGKFTLAERWRASLRVDMPLVLTNVASGDDPGGRFVFGSGNLLTQVGVIYTLNDRWAFAAGSQFTFPTASRAATGSEQYVALPGAVFRCMLPERPPAASSRRRSCTPSTWAATPTRAT
jgi:hypothetical protein